VITADYSGATGYATSTGTLSGGQVVNAFGTTTRFVILDPADGTVDTPISVTVQAQDQFGNVVTTEGRDVTLTASGSASGDGVVNIVNGVGTLAISNTVPETVTLALTDTQGTTLDVSSTQSVVFGTGAATKYVVTVDNATPTAGADVAVTAQLTDQFGNPVASSGQTVTWSSTNGGIFSAPTSATNASGIATVTFTTSATVGTQHVVTATDGSSRTGNSPVIATQ